MKTNGNDILSSHLELKDRPFRTPEGYFESFKKEMMTKAIKPKANPWKKSIPYVAAAASLTLLFSVGAFLSNEFLTDNDFTDEDYILFSSSYISTAEYDDVETYQFAEAEINDDDIIEYLIYLGVSPESIELSK